MTEEKQRDKTENFHDALIQHGPLSQRIYLMKLGDAEPESLIPAMQELAEKNAYTKIFAKVAKKDAEKFLNSGYEKEAEIPGFYNGKDAGMFLAKYLSDQRRNEKDIEDIEKVMELAQEKIRGGVTPFLPGDVILRWCIPEDAEVMSQIYKKVFDSYPFPIDNPDYLIETMREHIVYFGIEIEGKLVSLASSEMDKTAENVEMTDFATLPEYRGRSFAVRLLKYMESQMKTHGIKTAYTIARAVSAGMNITFAKSGYHYAGRLKSNTNISGSIESMNVWYKNL
ncbi:putative beta-lysine N-acetyltransferase [Limihaloglobus sulfuriphilus]|uniref:Putative beta-lysine N-acetyltransferase n=1 Tax=Limihaloglobus sulfuriphilus TaxID=1851148 RepID=A0A1Q2MH12_9BACT|nr:putative beta-lysine N-acetyltransferase [Limihaloglobus sulfuriphilus]AQQ71552.1 putative beta-lysine N-acetyltransferase [Limihaloglobus sulfuriphilus]